MAVFELDGYSSSDISAYETRFGLSTVPLQNVLIDGFNGVPNFSSNGGADEVTLDIELVTAFAPGSSNIYVYEAPNTTQAWIDEWTQIASDNKAKVISCSWGEPEVDSPTLSFDNTIFQQMAAQGQAVFVAAGDNGAFDAGGRTLGVDEPGSQPYVTAVGISKLTTNSSGAYSSETASVYGGGGVSAFWTIPSYQATLAAQAVKAATVSTTMRNMPDVVLTADASTAYAFYINGAWYGYYGSSISAPIWASFMSLVNQGLGASGPIGSVNSALYQLAQSSSYANDFHDLSTGNNGYYPAEAGFDDATGLGSFNGLNLYNDLISKFGAVAPPSQPTGLSAIASNAQVALSWSASSGAVSYNVKRSTVNGGPYTTIASLITNTTYTDNTVTNGSTYYYVVSALNSGGESSNSSQVSAMPVVSVTNLSITYPAVLSGQIVDNFSSTQALTRGNVTVQVAAPSAPSVWYTLSGDFAFIIDGNNKYTVLFPAGDFPANMLVKIAGQSPQTVMYTLAASAGSNGSISPSGSVTINSGASQIYTVIANTGYTASLTVDGAPVTLTNNAYTLSNVASSHIVVGSFTLQTETITASVGSGGTISPSGSVSVNYGSSQSFTVTPNAGYTAHLTVDGSTVNLTNNTYILSNVKTTHTVVASFILQTELMTVSAGSNGAISPSGPVSVNYGSNQVFTVTPNAGYTASLTVDGAAVTLTNNTYTLNNITSPHTIAASFTSSAISNLTVQYPGSSNGQITVNFSSTVAITRTNVVVQVAAPSAPTVWYTLSGDFAFIINGNNGYTVSLPASDFPAGVLVNIKP